MSKAELACKTDQLCGGLRAEIKGAVHAMKTMRASLKEEEEMDFLLINERNAFNEVVQECSGRFGIFGTWGHNSHLTATVIMQLYIFAWGTVCG